MNIVAEIQGNFNVSAAERDKILDLYGQISQEIAFNEKVHLEQRIEELETTVHNLDSEQLEQMSKVALMKDTTDSLETEMKRLTGKVLDSETDLLNEKTELRLSEIQRMQLNQEKIIHLDEKTEICTLKETIAQLNVEKSSLQDCVEEGRERIERIATFQESLAIKVCSNIQIVLYKKLAKYQTELDDKKLKAQDSNGDTFRLKYVLKSKSKCESNHTETELLRKQLGNEKASKKNLESLLVSNCENKIRSQKAKQEKHSEIQFLKEQLALVENNLENPGKLQGDYKIMDGAKGTFVNGDDIQTSSDF
ncbi:hypothetical protein HGM15179_014924 [Zosterops borbonicus]|uniref:Uncharacterized protein n=1 Tax=Zosterops borbonicus TaxID=364589 RepID=A0A8K1G5V2_9PASS|nr:hypothetical protein HGM15179_014924 [Zosterops borbonicus]